jgi:F-type H+-transporting ATPase subunit a
MHSAENPLIVHLDPEKFLGMETLINPATCAFLALILVCLLWTMARSKKMVPSGAQNFSEMVVEFLESLARPLMGRHTDSFLPLLNFLFLYIFFCNLLGLVPGLLSATSRVDVNVTLALTVFLATHGWGIKVKGLKNYLAHFMPPPLPMPPNLPMKILMGAIQVFMFVLMPIIHIIGEVARPLSLTMRLFGNIMAKEKLLAVLVLLIVLFWPISAFTKVLAVVPFVLRALIVVLGIFVSFVQALVFTLLTMVYIGGAIQEHEHEEHAEAAHA